MDQTDREGREGGGRRGLEVEKSKAGRDAAGSGAAAGPEATYQG